MRNSNRDKPLISSRINCTENYESASFSDRIPRRIYLPVCELIIKCSGIFIGWKLCKEHSIILFAYYTKHLTFIPCHYIFLSPCICNVRVRENMYSRRHMEKWEDFCSTSKGVLPEFSQRESEAGDAPEISYLGTLWSRASAEDPKGTGNYCRGRERRKQTPF